MTRLGIVVALAAEARTLGLHRYRRSGMMTLSHQVIVCISGIGPARARAAGERLLAHGANALLSWGTAAALDSELAPGQLLLPRSVLCGDLEPGPVSRDWRRQLHGKLCARFPINDKPLIAVDQVLVEPEQKRRLLAETGAVAADMESAELSIVARDAGVPFAVLRTIADSAVTTVPNWIAQGIDGFGRLRIASVLLPLIMRPEDWPDVAALAKDFRAALKTLKAIGADGHYVDLKPATPAKGQAASV